MARPLTKRRSNLVSIGSFEIIVRGLVLLYFCITDNGSGKRSPAEPFDIKLGVLLFELIFSFYLEISEDTLIRVYADIIDELCF